MIVHPIANAIHDQRRLHLIERGQGLIENENVKTLDEATRKGDSDSLCGLQQAPVQSNWLIKPEPHNVPFEILFSQRPSEIFLRFPSRAGQIMGDRAE